MNLEIKRFASFLVVKHSNLMERNPGLVNLNDFLNEKSTKEILDCIDYVLFIYKEFIDEFSTNNFKGQVETVLASKEKYMEFLLSRCLHLSGSNPAFFEFLLVCAYICSMSEYMFRKYNCCKILKITANCLRAVYCRRYWEYFAENERFSGLADFCKRLKLRSLENVNNMYIFCFAAVDRESKKKEYRLSKNLNIADDKVFLNENETKLLADEPFLVANLCSNEMKDFLVDCTTSDAISDLVQKGNEAVSQKAKQINKICGYCKAMCFRYFRNACE